MTDQDGFAHPATEEELVELVRSAYREGRQLRVRGAAHSVSHAIYTDPLGDMRNDVEQQTPPPGANVNVMLDRYRGWRVVDEEQRLVEADAGIHLGADPNDPIGSATLETSLLYQLWEQKGWTISETGGISHQTVSGFTATGSAGGSTKYSANDNLHGVRVIDGTGEVRSLTRDDDEFWAMFPSLGLLGVVSTITFRCDQAFNISGQEAISTVAGSRVDLTGPGGGGRVLLDEWLRGVEYGRIEWWPQRGVEKVLVWEAQRIAVQPGFEPDPYEEFTDHPQAAELLIALLYTILGNLDDLDRTKPALHEVFGEVDKLLDLFAEAHHLGWIGEVLAKFISVLGEAGADAAVLVLKPFAGRLEHALPELFPKILGLVIKSDDEKKGAQRGKPQTFRDHAYSGLPMDNQANDVLLPTEFSELWVPLPRAAEAVGVLLDWFGEPSDAHESYRRTGLYAWELYMTKATELWLAASYSSGDDEWADGAFRIDAYWFANNPGDPATTFYPPIWRLIRDAGIPMRLHWGKFQPVYEAGDRDWVDYFRSLYPKWDDFLALRSQRDPNNVFLNGYWRDRFGLWDAPAPAPVT